MVVTQHIPAGFSLAFANGLNKLCRMEVREAADGDSLHRGLALIRTWDYHLLLRRTGGGYAIELRQGPQVCYQRPSVDVMFPSVPRRPAVTASVFCFSAWGPMAPKGCWPSTRRHRNHTAGTSQAAWSTECRARQNVSMQFVRTPPLRMSRRFWAAPSSRTHLQRQKRCEPRDRQTSVAGRRRACRERFWWSMIRP